MLLATLGLTQQTNKFQTRQYIKSLYTLINNALYRLTIAIVKRRINISFLLQHKKVVTTNYNAELCLLLLCDNQVAPKQW